MVNVHGLNRIALASVFGLMLALPQAARSQTQVAAAEYIAGDREIHGLAGDPEEYDALRRVSDGLFERGEELRALRLREELGDLALSNGDAEVAAHAYLDAAWIARARARQWDDYARRTRGLNLDADVRWFDAEVRRLVAKAEGATESAGFSDEQLAGIRRRFGTSLTGD
jgi:hypothetical protein